MKLRKTITSPLNKGTNRLRLVLGDQLDIHHSWYKETDSVTVYLIAEMRQETDYAHHHIQKLCAFFSAMEHFALQLAKEGHQVLYLTLDETSDYESLNILLQKIIDQNEIEYFDYQRPDEYRLCHQLSLFCPEDVKIQLYESEHFLLEYRDIAKEFKLGTPSRMEFFYRRMRKRSGILMDGEKPLGGKWNYDSDNRSSLKPNDLLEIPEPKLFNNDTSDILSRLEKHKVNSIGHSTDELMWPVTREQCLTLLDYFCQFLLKRFGQFQDAMTGSTNFKWSLYHSRISFALNTKLVSPNEVVGAAIDYWEKHQTEITLSQIEGFVRQIIGWREYIRGIYWSNMPKYAKENYLSASRRLPEYFWTADTRMNCIKHAILQSLKFAYAHHIQRLMVTGNFCLLTGIHPDEVDRWYLGIYIDAIEWVEMPNTRGMAQFSDGGIVASKPYAASGSYINKMSDYCKNCHYKVKNKTEDDACPFNSLYWNFVAKHEKQFKSNPRMNMIYRSWDKMKQGQQQALLKKAKDVLINIENL